jgi:hypothetical protein
MRKFLIGLMLLVISLPAASQTPAAATPDAKEEAEKAERRSKAVALLGDTARDLRQMRASESRVRWQIQIAALLWPHDDKQSRELFQDAIAGWKEAIGQRAAREPSEDSRYSNNLYNLRGELAQRLASYDAAEALRFVRATRALVEPYLPDNAGQLAPELQLETSIAAQAVRKDPELALKLAQETLSQGVSGSHLNIAQDLRNSHRPAAQELLRQIYKTLSESDLAQFNTSYAGYKLLHFAHQDLRSTQPNNAAATPAFNETEIRRLAERMVATALSAATEPSSARNLIIYLTGWPELDKYAPGSKAQLQNRLNSFNQSAGDGNPWQQYNDAVSQKPLPEALSKAATAPPQIREGLYHQIAGRAAQAGDFAQARQIIAQHIRNANSRNQALRNLEYQYFQHLAHKGEFAEARSALARAASRQDRVRMSFILLNNLLGKDKKDEAAELLDYVSRDIAPRPANQNELQEYFNLLQYYQKLTPQRARPLLEPLVEQFNEMCLAAEKLNGFAGNFYQDGEFIPQGHALSGFTQQFERAIPELAQTEFDQAQTLAAKFNRPEMRVLLNIAIGRRTLESDGRSGKGRVVSPRPPVSQGGRRP